MFGWVKLTREFGNDDLWFHASAFRLYVWILLKASYQDGHVINGVELKKGQYLRAYSELGQDLMYVEGRSKKVLAKSTVKRAVDRLVKKGLLEVEETPLGTIFTIANFDEFKCQDNDDFFCPPYRETQPERNEIDCETEVERNKEVIKNNKNIKQQEDVQEIVEFWDANGFGFSNVNAKEQLLSWLDDSHFLEPKEMIVKALKLACANNKRKLNYVVAILKNWKNESLLTVDEVDSEDHRKAPPADKREFVLDIDAGEDW